MTKLKALRALAEKVEAQKIEGKYDPAFEHAFYKVSKTMATVYWASDAYHGSRDAAKALRDAFFDGWHVIIWGHGEYCVTLQNPRERHMKYTARGHCEGRTELLAIIKALIAKEERSAALDDLASLDAPLIAQEESK